MTTPSSPDGFAHSGLRTATILVTAYTALSLLTVAAIAVLSAVAPSLVSPQAWVRGVIVAATSILTLVFARRARRAGARALLRLRIVLVVILVAVVGVLLFVTLPGWMVAEQGVCGLLLLCAAVLAFRASPAGPADGR
ncbi:hypothetical protein GCM10010149_44280 [Nonomuraea roseoviolacea subsp. roseoviolacea]|uniref:FtsH-binding integral membrane protein n=1 Tax=Nonomuraea roseoviolacea subsp. carminata TaxID=160689 RepID=A0ABT1JZ23_9ACTN|nr:hypothetical protein [Nonomuraea roseoviolacea]MCP2346994.1 FtsH-binding integral membrane protein [Nonomuraea roseoviolacea subsp. carminata]